jgi:peptidoglycan hydrolase-like protein with peptidoglycan-binding domain
LDERGAPTSASLPLPAEALPDVTTIGGLQTALKMLGYRITVDGDYGPETRQMITSFQMHAGIVADGVAGAQTEAQLIRELNDLRSIEAQTVRARP